MDMILNKKFGSLSVILSAALLVALATVALPRQAAAQDQYGQQDDPPSRVARLGYMEGSVSFQPAGESEWVQAVDNRPITTGDKLWADRDSRAEVQLGSAVIRLAPNTGFSFLNLDDRTVQIQLTSGALDVSVRRLERDDVFEVDTPNQAFSVFQPGTYRVEASEDGNYTVVSVWEGEGESTGNGQNYTLHAGQKGTFSGTDTLTADVEQIGGRDDFDNWAYNRERRYHDSRSARYVSPDVVGYDDLDEYGDWRDDPSYGNVWFPSRVSAGWAPYRDGHWDWIDPWGWTWVDDSPWGYAPFHYGRWVTVGGRWGWVAGPRTVAAVYAPALVVFIGGGPGGFGGNVGWFPLGPREVYVPSYPVSQGYMTRVNVSNTTVNTTTITNVYNTTIVNKSTTITNVNYVNRNVQGAVTAVPQRAFVSAQPVAKAAVAVNARELASVPVSSRVSVAPTRESVLGARAGTANHVAAPPRAVASRQVIAKATPPPPPVPFAQKQQALAAHPGQPLARQEVQKLRPAATAQAHPQVRQAPPGKPATPNMGRPANQPNAGRPGQPGNAPPANQPSAGRPGQPANAPPANQPANRPGNQPAPNERPGAANPAQPNRPPSAQPNRPEQAQPGSRPEPNRQTQPPARADRPPSAQPNRPEQAQPGNRPEPNRPTEPPARNDRPPSAQPNRGEPTQPGNRPEPNRPTEPPARNERPPSAQPNRAEPAQPSNRPEPNRPTEPPARNERPPSQPNRAEPAQPSKRPEPNRPIEPPARNERPPAQPNRAEPSRPAEPPARTERPPSAQPNRAEPPQRQERKQAPEEKKQEKEKKQPPPSV